MPPTETDLSQQHKEKATADKILIIHNNVPMILIGNLLASIPMTAVLYIEGFNTGAIEWIGTLHLITAIRWLHYHSFKPQEASLQKTSQQGKGYTLMALLSGCFWGSTAIIFFEINNVPIFTTLILTLVSMVGGSMTSLSSRPLNFACFAIPALGPVTVLMLSQDILFYRWLSLGMTIFTVTTIIFSRNLHNVINDSIILKYKNIELASELKDQTEAANKANSDKSRFIATASHDLRQPLHAVNLFMDSLGNKITTEEQQHDLNRIHRGLDSLGDLFNALLDISQLDAETIRINKINFQLKEQLKTIVDQFSPDAEAKGLNLTLNNCDQVIHSDPVLFEQLVRNLLSNAIRYTEKGSIEIFTTHNTDDSINMHIRDTGIGISAKDSGNIFNEFVQLDNPERNRDKGLGLGLSIVRRTAKLLQHQITFDSSPGKGTEFIIELPLGDSTDLMTDSSEQTFSKENKLEGLEVMVVDNETDILHGMKNLLKTWGCNVTTASSTEKAIELVDNGSHPEFILSDYRMPGNFNGCELVKEIRVKTGDIPALIITGETKVDVITEIKAENHFLLSKPVKPAQLRVAMTRLLNTNISPKI